MTLPLPRYVIAKRLVSGRVAFYYMFPKLYRELGCTVPNTPLGTDYTIACGEDGRGGRAAALNAAFDEWNRLRQGLPVTGERAPVYGTLRWLFQEYRRSKAYLEKVAPRSRRDYERTMQLIESIFTKKGDSGDRLSRIGNTYRHGQDLRKNLIGPDGGPSKASREGRDLAGVPGALVHRLYPTEFNRDVPNPWDGVTIKRRVKAKKRAVTREDVYRFADGAINSKGRKLRQQQ